MDTGLRFAIWITLTALVAAPLPGMPAAAGIVEAQGRIDRVVCGPDGICSTIHVRQPRQDPKGAKVRFTHGRSIPCYSKGPFVKVFYDRSGGANRLDARAPDAERPRLREAIALADRMFNEEARRFGKTRHIRWKMKDCTLLIKVVNLSTPQEAWWMARALRNKGLLKSGERALVLTAGGNGECEGDAMSLTDDRRGPSNGHNTQIMAARVSLSCGGTALAEVIAHELLHTFGAVQRSAPRSTREWHCWDIDDVMCYQDGSGSTMVRKCATTIPQRIDCGNNDYFHPKPKRGSYLDVRWNAARNIYLARAAPPAVDLLEHPDISFITPVAGQRVGGATQIEFEVTSPPNAPLTTVSISANGTTLKSWTDPDDGRLRAKLLANGWPAGEYRNGEVVKLRVHAEDVYRRSAVKTRDVIVANPTGRFTSPLPLEAVSRTVRWAIDARATGAKSVASVEVSWEGVPMATDAIPPYEGEFDIPDSFEDRGGNISAIVSDSDGATRQIDRDVMVVEPEVQLIAPFDRYQAGASFTAAARAVSIGPAIDHVEFSIDGVLAAVDATAPYATTLPSPAAGEHTVSVIAVDVDGARSEPDEADITVSISTSDIAVTAPVEGASVAGTSVTLAAAPAPAPGETVRRVHFYVDGTSVGSTGAAPWEVTWDSRSGDNQTHVVTARLVLESASRYEIDSDGTSFVISNPGAGLKIITPGDGAVARRYTPVTVRLDGLPAGAQAGVQVIVGGDPVNWFPEYVDRANPTVTINWDSFRYDDDQTTIRARAFLYSLDRPQVIVTDAIHVAIVNQTPKVIKPRDGDGVSGRLRIEGRGWVAESMVEWLRFRLDGKNFGRVAPKALWPRFDGGKVWKSRSASNGWHELLVESHLSDGRVLVSDPIRVRVNN